MDKLRELKKEIEKRIDIVWKKFKNSKGIILTESDLKCLLFNEFMGIEKLSEDIQTQDSHIWANALHTEISWYDKNGKLTITPDISIVEPENLSILHGMESRISTLPRKQYSFGGNAVIFELKFNRTKRLSKSTMLREIEYDYNKIQGLFEKLRNEGNPGRVFCYFVIFTKTSDYCNEFNEFIQEHKESENHKFIIKSAELTF